MPSFRVGVFPLIGVRLALQLSIGSQVGYGYVNYYGPRRETSSYGGSLFARFRLAPPLYLHSEGRYVSYERFDAAGASTPPWVPFLLLGGGFVQRLSPRTSAYAEALFDVLQNSKSPYDGGEPFLPFGVMVGYSDGSFPAPQEWLCSSGDPLSGCRERSAHDDA